MGIDVELYVRTRASVAPAQVEDWRYRMCEAFGADRFIQLRADGTGPELRALEVVDDVLLVDPPLRPEEGDGITLLQVHPLGRYYGVGYERGDLRFLVTLAMWLEAVVPLAEVWYGGDCDVTPQPFGPAERQQLWAHYCRHGHEPYERGFRPAGGPTPDCDFCRRPMRQFRHGPGQTGFYCPGCENRVESNPGGSAWVPPFHWAEPGTEVVTFDLERLSPDARAQVLGFVEALVKEPRNRAVHFAFRDWLSERYDYPIRGNTVGGIGGS